MFSQLKIYGLLKAYCCHCWWGESTRRRYCLLQLFMMRVKKGFTDPQVMKPALSMEKHINLKFRRRREIWQSGRWRFEYLMWDLSRNSMEIKICFSLRHLNGSGSAIESKGGDCSHTSQRFVVFFFFFYKVQECASSAVLKCFSSQYRKPLNHHLVNMTTSLTWLYIFSPRACACWGLQGQSV